MLLMGTVHSIGNIPSLLIDIVTSLDQWTFTICSPVDYTQNPDEKVSCHQWATCMCFSGDWTVLLSG